MITGIESSAPITSAAPEGVNTKGSNGRTYWTRGAVIDDGRLLRAELMASEVLAYASNNGVPNRRSVYKARVTDDALRDAANAGPMPRLEVAIPLREVDTRSSDWLIMHGHNLHHSPVPEWPEVYQYWENPPSRTYTPLERVEALPNSISLTMRPNNSDIESYIP